MGKNWNFILYQIHHLTAVEELPITANAANGPLGSAVVAGGKVGRSGKGLIQNALSLLTSGQVLLRFALPPPPMLVLLFLLTVRHPTSKTLLSSSHSSAWLRTDSHTHTHTHRSKHSHTPPLEMLTRSNPFVTVGGCYEGSWGLELRWGDGLDWPTTAIPPTNPLAYQTTNTHPLFLSLSLETALYSSMQAHTHTHVHSTKRKTHGRREEKRWRRATRNTSRLNVTSHKRLVRTGGLLRCKTVYTFRTRHSLPPYVPPTPLRFHPAQPPHDASLTHQHSGQYA